MAPTGHLPMIDPTIAETDIIPSQALAPHVRRNCECRTLYSPVHDIQRIHQSGGYAILGISTGETDKLSLYAKEYDGKTPYILFTADAQQIICSPVWNTITTCQLMQLAMRLGKIYVQEIRAELCFWLAGLCVPIDCSGSTISVSDIRNNAYRMLQLD